MTALVLGDIRCDSSEGFTISYIADNAPETVLTNRQAAVLRVMVKAYIGEAAPIGSGTLANLLPVRVSSRSEAWVVWLDAEATRLEQELTWILLEGRVVEEKPTERVEAETTVDE